MKLRHFAAAWLLMGAAGAAAQGQTLRVAINNDPDILDPTLSRTFVGTAVMSALCDKLFDFDEALAIVPRLATSFEWADPVTLILHLRPGVTFHDGTPFDAAAVKFNLDRHAGLPGSFRRAELGAMDRVEVEGPLTVRIVLKQPASPFIATLTDRSGMMVSPTAAAAAGKEFGLHPVCSGPFRFVERVAQDHITLERFPGYWDAGSVHFDRVTFRPMTDSAVRLANLQAGAVDLADIVPSDVDAVRADLKLQLLSSSGLGYAGITFNVGHGPRAGQPIGRDARVRQAFALSLDRDVIVQVVFNGQFTPNAQAVSAGNPLFVPEVRPPPRNPARARALLREAGVAPPVAVPLTVPNNPQSLQVAEIVQSMAQEGGFDVQVTAMDFGTSLATTLQGDYAAYLNGWSGLLDADSNTWSFLHTGGALNISGYSNAGVDAALDEARVATDPAARRALYSRVWQQQAADLPILYLYTPRYIMGARKQVQGYRVLPDGLIRLQGVSLAAP